MLSYHLTMGIALLIDTSRRVELKAILRSRNYKLPLIMALFGAAGGVVMYLLWPYLQVPDGIGDYLRTIGLSQDSWPFFLVYFVLVNPIMEELFWRGYLGSLKRGLVFNDFMFAGYHALILTGKMGIIWLSVIMLTLLGGAWLWRQVNRLGGGLMCSIVSHATADLSIMLVMFFLIY
jgi:membrane protease YdiL (CAAX protease family)